MFCNSLYSIHIVVWYLRKSYSIYILFLRLRVYACAYARVVKLAHSWHYCRRVVSESIELRKSPFIVSRDNELDISDVTWHPIINMPKKHDQISQPAHYENNVNGCSMTRTPTHAHVQPMKFNKNGIRFHQILIYLLMWIE